MANTKDAEVLVVTGPDEEALGIISQLDMLPFYGQNLKGVRGRRCVMRANVIAIPPEMSVKEAAAIMVERGISDLIVTVRGDVGLRGKRAGPDHRPRDQGDPRQQVDVVFQPSAVT